MAGFWSLVTVTCVFLTIQLYNHWQTKWNLVIRSNYLWSVSQNAWVDVKFIVCSQLLNMKLLKTHALILLTYMYAIRMIHINRLDISINAYCILYFTVAIIQSPAKSLWSNTQITYSYYAKLEICFCLFMWSSMCMISWFTFHISMEANHIM